MNSYRLEICVRFKEGILNPESEAIVSALQKLEFSTIENVDCRRSFVVSFQAETEDQARELGKQMAEKLLVNPVMEDFQLEILS